MRISDWSSDVCSSDLARVDIQRIALDHAQPAGVEGGQFVERGDTAPIALNRRHPRARGKQRARQSARPGADFEYLGIRKVTRDRRDPAEKLAIEQEVLAERLACTQAVLRSEEQTSELQSLMRNSYAVFCLK